MGFVWIFAPEKFGIHWFYWARLLKHPWWEESVLLSVCITSPYAHLRHDPPLSLCNYCVFNKRDRRKGWRGLRRWLISICFTIACCELPASHLVILTRPLLSSNPTRLIATPRFTLYSFLSGNAHWLFTWRRSPTCCSTLDPQKCS